MTPVISRTVHVIITHVHYCSFLNEMSPCTTCLKNARLFNFWTIPWKKSIHSNNFWYTTSWGNLKPEKNIKCTPHLQAVTVLPWEVSYFSISTVTSIKELMIQSFLWYSSFLRPCPLAPKCSKWLYSARVAAAVGSERDCISGAHCGWADWIVAYIRRYGLQRSSSVVGLHYFPICPYLHDCNRYIGVYPCTILCNRPRPYLKSPQTVKLVLNAVSPCKFWGRLYNARRV